MSINDWWPNDIRVRGPCGPRAFWHLSCRWGKTPRKPHPRNLSWSGIEPPPYRYIYVTQATRPYRATTCRGRDLKLWIIYTYFFDYIRAWTASPEEWSAQCRGHLRDSTNKKDNIHQTHTQIIPRRWIWNDDNDGQMIFGDLVDLELPDICLTQETCSDTGSIPMDSFSK